MEIRNWAPDLIERDDDTLVQQIRTRVLPRRGVFAMPDEIVVTIGAQQAFYLIADLLASERHHDRLRKPRLSGCPQHLREPRCAAAAAARR